MVAHCCDDSDIRCFLDPHALDEGKIQVVELLTIKSKASIHGEVICGKLAVEPGAEFSATCVMKPNIKLLLSHNNEGGTEEKTA